MAKQQHGINDGYRGSVGTVIGYQWRDVWCLRSRPVRVRNPRTPQQQAGRSVFGIVSSLAAGFSTALRLGLQQESRRQGMTARNLFVRLNRPAVTLTDDGVEVDYPSFAVAAGPVAPVAFDAAAVDGLSVVVPFERNPLHLRTDSADEVYRLTARLQKLLNNRETSFAALLTGFYGESLQTSGAMLDSASDLVLDTYHMLDKLDVIYNTFHYD